MLDTSLGQVKSDFNEKLPNYEIDIVMKRFHNLVLVRTPAVQKQRGCNRKSNKDKINETHLTYRLTSLTTNLFTINYKIKDV